jgi:hypothetical protein
MVMGMNSLLRLRNWFQLSACSAPGSCRQNIISFFYISLLLTFIPRRGSCLDSTPNKFCHSRSHKVSEETQKDKNENTIIEIMLATLEPANMTARKEVFSMGFNFFFNDLVDFLEVSEPPFNSK